MGPEIVQRNNDSGNHRRKRFRDLWIADICDVILPFMEACEVPVVECRLHLTCRSGEIDQIQAGIYAVLP